MFTKGVLVVNLTCEVAKVVGTHPTGEPILRAVNRKLKPVGGKWLANPAMTRVLTGGEVVRFMNGEMVVR